MIIQDFKYALRLLSKTPGFTVLTTLVMAAGIGLSVYMFSFFNTILYKDLPFEDGESIVILIASLNGEKNDDKINLLDYQAIKNGVSGLTEFGGYYNDNVNVSGRDGARRYNAVTAETNIFQITRIKPLIGREFTKEEGLPGAEKVVIIGFDIWQNQFGGDPEITQQTLRINSEPHQIIGVMPQGYFFPNVAQMWLPLRADLTQLTRDKSIELRGLARLKPGVSIQEVDKQLDLVMKRLEQKYPKSNSGLSVYVTSLPGSGAGDGQPVIYTMHIVTVLILILASINVGNLLLSRAIERSKETAIRVALGAPRARLISQMLWESIIICTLGGMIGLLMVAWGLEVSESIVATFFVDPPAFWWKFGIDSYTIKLFLIIVVTTILVTGLLPAWKNSGGDFNAVLRDGTRGALGKKAGRLNRILVISEIFISMTVLIAAAVMVHAAYVQSHQDIGADIENTLTARVLLSESNYDTDEKQVQFAKTLESRLENSMGISHVMISTALPGSYSYRPKIAIEGNEYTQNNNMSYPLSNYIAIMPGSLSKLGVELKSGRYFNRGDDGLGKTSVLVSEDFVTRHFPGSSALGKRIRIMDSEEKIWLTIVGIVGNTIQGDRETKMLPAIYRPFTQAPRQQLSIAMHMKSDEIVATQTLRKILNSIDPELPSFRIETYEASNARSVAPIQFMSFLCAIFGVATMVLAASGIYGVMSNTINQRTQEIGIKRALGADEKAVTREFLLTGFKQLLWGGIPGVMAGSAMGFAMSQMFGTGNSILSLIAIGITVIIGAVVMLATYLPTQSALEIEPSAALHYE